MRLSASARARFEELRRLGVIRSKVLVGDLGELVGANFYGGELAPVFAEGYDLIARDGRRVP